MDPPEGRQHRRTASHAGASEFASSPPALDELASSGGSRKGHARSTSFGGANTSPGSSSRRRPPPPSLELSPPSHHKTAASAARPSPTTELGYALGPSPILPSPSEDEDDRYADPTDSDDASHPLYSGLGLGLPWSKTGGGTGSSSGASAEVRTPPSAASTRVPLSAVGRTRQRDNSVSGQSYTSSSSGASPVLDRTRLIGLGELATPRWTAAQHERRWGEETTYFGDAPPLPVRVTWGLRSDLT